jgi:hypothetical protein
VVVALSSGSPLDELDEALRSADAGGIGSFFAKRKLPEDPGTTVVARLADDHREDLRSRELAGLT